MNDIEIALNREFVECYRCRDLPGTPTLCPPCLANRTTIEFLRIQLEKHHQIAKTYNSMFWQLASLVKETGGLDMKVIEACRKL